VEWGLWLSQLGGVSARAKGLADRLAEKNLPARTKDTLAARIRTLACKTARYRGGIRGPSCNCPVQSLATYDNASSDLETVLYLDSLTFGDWRDISLGPSPNPQRHRRLMLECRIPGPAQKAAPRDVVGISDMAVSFLRESSGRSSR